MLGRTSGLAVICVGLWSSQAGCGSRLLAPDGSAVGGRPGSARAADDGPGLVPQDAGSGPRPTDGGRWAPLDGSSDSTTASDGAPTTTPPIAVAGGCDLELQPTRTWEASPGTLAAPGPYRPCAVVGGQAFSTMVVSADGRRAAGIGAGGQVQVLDARSLAPLGTFMRARGAYGAIALSGDGTLFAAGGAGDGELDVWSVDDHVLLAMADLGGT